MRLITGGLKERCVLHNSLKVINVHFCLRQMKLRDEEVSHGLKSRTLSRRSIKIFVYFEVLNRKPKFQNDGKGFSKKEVFRVSSSFL